MEMRKKIMICDDDEGILEMMEMLLDDCGYDVVIEANSTLVLKKLEQEMPDLLLLDIWMPVISGDQVFRHMKLNEKVSHIPVLMYSASNDGEKIASSVGANDYITKPFNLEEMELKIKQLL